MVEHHRRRNAEDPDWCLKEIWREAEESQADVLLITDFRTRADLRFFAARCRAPAGGALACLRIEASSEARSERGWTPDIRKDTLYTETELDDFRGWTAGFDNSAAGTSGLAAEWVEHTAVPRIL